MIHLLLNSSHLNFTAVQRCILLHYLHTCRVVLFGHAGTGSFAECLCCSERSVSLVIWLGPSLLMSLVDCALRSSLHCRRLLPRSSRTALPLLLGDFPIVSDAATDQIEVLTQFLVNGWSDGYAFILSFLAPLWTICEFSARENNNVVKY